MIAAAASDVDGLGILFGENAYWNWHHTFGHSLLFALIAGSVLAAFTPPRLASFLLYVAMVHLHLLLDFFGSGCDWPIPYLWPTHALRLINPYSWNLYSWQNLSFFAGFLIWTIWIALRQGRTPLEVLMPGLDQKIVRALRKWARSAVPA